MMCRLTWFRVALGFFLVLAACSRAEFLAGADMSHLKFFEDRGIIYREAGQPGDALVILKKQGLNCVRLRLFTGSDAQAQADPYNAINNLSYTVPLAVRVKQAGLKWLLDFHYSDTWADPGKQAKPGAWTGLAFGQLEAQVRSYTSNAITAFAAAGAMPDYVQVGNEIIGGLLWNDGRVGGAYDTSIQWTNLGRLLKAAIQGTQEAAGAQMPKIILHLDRGGDWGGTQWFFDRINQQNVAYDVIGQSYYPWWHGSPDNLRTCLSNTASRYGKPVMVVETAFPWTNSTSLYGMPASTNGQMQFVTLLAEIVKGLGGGKGAGIFWWGSEYQALAGFNLAGFDQKSLFRTGGDVLPAATVLGRLTAPVKMSARIQGPDLFLNWPLSGAGMRLMRAGNLDSGWAPVTNQPQSNGTDYLAMLPLDPGPGQSWFFRLQAQ